MKLGKRKKFCSGMEIPEVDIEENIHLDINNQTYDLKLKEKSINLEN